MGDFYKYVAGMSSAIKWLVASGLGIILLRWLQRMIANATNLDCGYNWNYRVFSVAGVQQGIELRPNLDVRNRSRSRTYRLATIRYEQDGKLLYVDSTSLMGKELKPSSIEAILDAKFIPQKFKALVDFASVKVTLQCQDKTLIHAHGPDQPQNRVRYWAIKLREKLEALSIHLD